MGEEHNSFGQPVGTPVPGWVPCPRPERTVVEGRFCRLEPLDPAVHGEQLYEGILEDPQGQTWTYLYYGPFNGKDEFLSWLRAAAAGDDPLFFTVMDKPTGRALGVVSYLRVEPAGGSIAVGHIIFVPSLRGTPAATECLFLMLRRAFDQWGYRRCEWRCDTLNAKSWAAAMRFGFRLEGVFRQATVNKGRNRDTACFSMIDGEWPRVRANFERWLAPSNFDASGKQRERLSELNDAR